MGVGPGGMLELVSLARFQGGSALRAAAFTLAHSQVLYSVLYCVLSWPVQVCGLVAGEDSKLHLCCFSHRRTEENSETKKHKEEPDPADSFTLQEVGCLCILHC